MKRMKLALATILAGTLTTAVAQAPKAAPGPEGKVAAKFEPVAETKLIMEGIVLPNFRGLEELLKTKPPDAELWTIIRGQALLIGESGNLLLVGPPSKGVDAWNRHAMELRAAASAIGRAAAEKDLAACRTGFSRVTATCNSCHKTFRIPVRFGPAEVKSEKAPRPQQQED